MGNVFEKQPAEVYSIAMQFLGALPPGTSLATGAVSAINLTTGADATAVVLVSATAGISGTQAQCTVKDGVNGTDYKITFRVSLTPGTPTPILEEDILMLVREE